MDFKDNTGVKEFLLKKLFSFLTEEIGRIEGEGEKLREIGNKEEKNTTIRRTSDFKSIEIVFNYYNYYNYYKCYTSILESLTLHNSCL